MATALYGPDGLFTGARGAPVDHFRTSVHASPLFAAAIGRLLRRLDAALGEPPVLDVVDVGAGRGELLTALLGGLAPDLADRVRLTAVEVAPRPADLPEAIRWSATLPRPVTGLLVATEWLDNVPVDVVEVDDAGVARYVLVDGDGHESLGEPPDPPDRDWLARWWPLSGATAGTRAEIGRPRDEAWWAAVSTVRRGLALAVDYGHTATSRPTFGTLTGYRAGRQVPPVPDGRSDLTAHVAMDALAGSGAVLVAQRDALRELGVRGTRPPLDLAARDPAGYLRGLADASQAGELTDPAGLGGHLWLLQPVEVALRLPCQA
ncbi:MAG TPA: SAM-dependent methyltransferase [Micromonosporaceae bacterium]